MKSNININSGFGTKAIMVVAILVLINILSAMFYKRIDLTKDHRYTLSEGTKTLVENLNEVLTIKAYMSKDVPAEIDNHRREVLNILQEYRELSNGNIEIIEIDPTTDEEKNEAIQLGIPQINLQEQAKDKLEVQTAFLGLSFELGSQSDVIPFLGPNQPIEYPISKSIFKVNSEVRQKVGLISGHGETPKSNMPQLTQEAGIFYEIEEVKLDGAKPLSDYKALLWINPSDSLKNDEFALIDNYLANGGGLFVAYSNGLMNGGQQNQPLMFVDNSTPLESWLNSKGITFEESVVFDVNAQDVPVSMFEQRRIYYFPIIQNFGEHLITSGLDNVMLQLSSPVSYTGNGTFSPLLLTSEMSGSEEMPVYFDLNKQWRENMFNEKSLIVGGALQTENEKIVVVANGEFIANGQGQNMQRISPGNINLLLNSMDWLSGNTELTELRGKGMTTVDIKNIEEGKRNFYKYLNFLLPLILIILYGIFRFQAKKAKRLKWKEMSL
ncbi:hypothetical protein GC194_09815 [bacterium]|nr:hypothetical protein [bacterium]